MAWGRVLRVVVRTPGTLSGGVWTYTETEVQALRVECSVTRSRVFRDNEATITIYNANADTRNRVLRRGSNVAVYAGYERGGDEGLIYQGNILDASSVDVGPDNVTTIRSMALRSLERPFTATPVSLSFKAGTTADKVLAAIGAILGLVVVGKAEAAKVTLKGTWTYVGGVGGALERLGRDMRAQGRGLYIDLAELVCYSLVGDSTYRVTYLDRASGLLELVDTTDYMAAARATIDTMGEKEGSPSASAPVVKAGTDDVYAAIEQAWTSVRKTYSARTIMVPSLRPNDIVQVKDGDVDAVLVVDGMEIEAGNGPRSGFGMTLSLVEV